MYRNFDPPTDRARRRNDRRGSRQRHPARRRTGRAGRRLWPAVVAAVSLAAIVCAAALLFSMVNSPAYQPDSPATAAAESVPTASSVPEAAESVPTAGDVPEQAGETGAAGPDGAGWLEWKEGQFVQVEYGTDTSTHLDTSGFIDPSTKNSHDLVEWAKMAWENQWGYVWGTFGYILTEDLLASKLEQYPDDLSEYEDVIREKWMGRRVADCVGLIKGYGWYDPTADSIGYTTNGMPDTGTDGMWNAADVKGDIGTMPDEPGLLVYSTAGHIGVYIGDGDVIEAISHAGGVVKTKLADRTWTGWLQCPYVSYDN